MNERKQLAVKNKIAIAMIESIIVFAATFNTWMEVSIKKQIPSKFAEVFKICGALVFFIVIFL